MFANIRCESYVKAVAVDLFLYLIIIWLVFIQRRTILITPDCQWPDVSTISHGLLEHLIEIWIFQPVGLD